MPIKRHAAIAPLSRQHYKGLLLAQLLKRDTPDYKGLPTTMEGKIKYAKEAWRNELKPHFELEEQILFPVAEASSAEIKEMIVELLEEHRTIQHAIAALDPSDVDKADSEMDSLGRLLESHIRKEERQVFNRIQELVPENELEKIRPLLEAHERGE